MTDSKFEQDNKNKKENGAKEGTWMEYGNLKIKLC